MDEIHYTIELCKKLRADGGWPGAENPKDYSVNNPYGEGAWVDINRVPALPEDWIPNPGRQQLHDEILKLIGEDRFYKEVILDKKMEYPKQAYSHEQWMELWLKYREELKGQEPQNK